MVWRLDGDREEEEEEERIEFKARSARWRPKGSVEVGTFAITSVVAGCDVRQS